MADHTPDRRALVAFIGVADLDRARTFYGEWLSLPLEDQAPYALVAHVGDALLRITAVQQVLAAPYTVLGLVVADVEREIDRLSASGVVFRSYRELEQDPRGIWQAPSGARIAWCEDPDGNLLSLTELPRLDDGEHQGADGEG